MLTFGDGNHVEPSAETIGESEDFAYSQFTRPVFTYLNTNVVKDEPQRFIRIFAIYAMENAQEVLVKLDLLHFQMKT